MAKQYKYKTATLKLPNGKRKYVRAKTQAELDAKMAELKKELGLGIKVDDNTKFQAYADHWVRVTKEPYITENTLTLLRSRLRLHVYPVIGNMKVRDIRAAHVRDVMYRCSDLGKGSQSAILSLLRAIFNAAVDDNIILRSPVPLTMKAQGKPTGKAEALTPEQEAELLRVTQGTVLGDTIYAMLQTGMRRGEVTALRWSDVHPESNTVSVTAHVVTNVSTGVPQLVDGAKTDAGVRDIPVTPEFMRWLMGKKREARSVFVFPNSKGSMYSSPAYSALWTRLQKQLSFHVHPHMLRHTYVTKLFEQGLDITEIQTVVGHADPSITLETYTHYRADTRKASTNEKVRAALSG